MKIFFRRWVTKEMILNLTKIKNKQIITPEIEFDDNRKRRLAVISLQCKLENKPDSQEIYCLKSNLVARSLSNPEQILCFVSTKTRFISFNPPHLMPFNMMSNSFQGGIFYLESLETEEEIPIESAALQISVRRNE